jgi:pimeloyl-ACP methyl ester carboxylesterase
MESLTGWRWLRLAAITLAAFALSAYLLVGAVFYFTQDGILFPAPKAFDKSVPRVPYEDLRILVKGTEYLHAWWIPAAQPTGKVMLVFHGNGYVLEDMAGDEVLDLKAIGIDLLLIDYRGYGSSARISPNARTVNEDAIAGFNYLLFQRRTDVGKVFILGRSIGSGPATFLALKNSALGGLILESPAALTMLQPVPGTYGFILWV